MKPRQDGKRQRIRKVIVALAATLFVVYVLKGAALYAFQRKFLYVPPMRPVTATEKGITVAEPVTADGLHLKAWFVPPKGGKPVVLSFHGNGDDLMSSALVMPYFRGRGYGVMLCEYRGYSENPGTPDEEGLYADGRACIGWLKLHGYGADKLVLHGHSLGTGVAVQMASEIQPKFLILESAFTSIVEMAGAKYPAYPVNLMVRDRFDSLSKIGKVKSDLLMVHGALDGLIPIEMGRRLFDAASKPKTFISVKDGGHNDLYLHGGGEIIADWLDKQVKASK
jgi:fermentation-respiration switch protein FrsA (DUF1100 family)